MRSAIKTSVASSWHFISTYNVVEFQLNCEMERRVRYMDLLIIRNDRYHEIDISRNPTTNDRTHNNYTTFLLNVNWQLMLISEIIGVMLVQHTIHSNAPCGKKHKFPFMLMYVVKYSTYRAWRGRAVA